MAGFDRILKLLRTEKNMSQQELADALGISKSSINMYERGERQPNFELLETIADFFNVDIDYLLGRTMKTTRIIHPGRDESINLTQRDERDIKRDLDSIMEKLTSKESGPAAYDGEELSDESAALFRDELEIALRRLKLINKEKYNPNKNKK